MQSGSESRRLRGVNIDLVQCLTCAQKGAWQGRKGPRRHEEAKKGRFYCAAARAGACARSAEEIVFTSSMVTVIGPTPPGTGVM
jgi:hypothetical protein